MGKVLKWFFGIIVMILIIGVILMFCGILKFKYSSPIPGTYAYLTVYDYKNRDLTTYMKCIGCNFQGIAFDFSGAKKTNTEDIKEDLEEEEEDMEDTDDEDLWDNEDDNYDEW